MRLYSGTTKSLIEDSVYNRIASKLSDAFFAYYRFRPAPSEVNSWRNSIRAVSQVFQNASLLNNGVILELELPLTSLRLDCLLTGRDEVKVPNAVIIELKQWERCVDGAGSNEVATWVGGALRDRLHPSAQVGQYKSYLEDCHPAFSGENAIGLYACSYLHNYLYDSADVIFSSKFSELVRLCPLFTGDDVEKLVQYLQPKLIKGDDMALVERVEQGRYRATRKLLDHVAAVIKGQSEYVLLDEQLVAYDSVLQSALEGMADRKKHVVIVKGGPGTGKSVIAMKLLGDLSEKGLTSHYVNGSGAFSETVRKIVGTRASAQIKYTNAYKNADFNVVDVLICDEAHRIRETSNTWTTPSAKKTDVPQVVELLNAAKTPVFLLDDDQLVRPDEIGSIEYIRQQAEALGCVIREYELAVQFRCAGSEGFVNWINNTLGVRRTANVIWTGAEGFEFRIFDSPESLELAIRQRAAQGFTARMTAGFCWRWSNPNNDGTLVNDVVLGNYRRPWNARSGKGRLAKGIPRERLWAYQAGGIDQVGCVYTAQGFEFDYVGVIFGTDLVYDPALANWKGNSEASADPAVRRSSDFLKLVKNTYRVLLTRGMKGCYVYFMDKDTEHFFRSRTEDLPLPGAMETQAR
jgi:DUF2075 family protein